MLSCRKGSIVGAGLLALALSGCGEAGDSTTRDQILAVGSSTVYPFTSAVAENFARKNPDFKVPIVESIGTGGGFKQFCGGVGARFADIANASRRIKKSELDTCRANGVTQMIEIQVGIDGIAMAESKNGPAIALSRADIYKALAATPFGRPQTAQTWADVNPALPATPILVYGPSPTSGTRDAFAELILEKGCDTDPAMEAVKKADADKHKSICTKIREDKKYVETGENDNLIVQKLAANPDAVGVFGYSFLEENIDRVRGIPIEGVVPTYASIADFSYPGSRPLFIYVKSAHLNAIPGLREFLAEYAGAWKPGGYLSRRGLISAPADVEARNAEIATKLTPLDLATVK